MDTPIPFAGCFSTESDPTLPLVFAGLPCDAQSTFRRGPADAPSRIRLAYDGRCYNATTELGADLAGLVSDAGDWFPGGSWEDTREEYRFRAEELLAGEAVPFFAGGDHAITIPLVEALEVLEEPVHVVQLDAHPDLYPEFEGDRWSHACVGARILEMEHIASLTQIGIRTLNQPQLEVARRHAGRLTILEARDLSIRPSDLSHIPDGAAVYLTVDLDAFDPAYAPGVSHPVPGGISPRQALALIQEAPWRLVGMDAVEVNPS
ncbi:MAG: arginase family protein, partial [marine benthic group bacterium]|nr:arginase family protein [Gemmatimonadota bacterium]